MRKITQEAVDAFMAGALFDKQNTRVEIRPWQSTHLPRNQVILVLHGNPIARYEVGLREATLTVCDGNHQTNTTKERLNGIPGVRVHQKAGQWYLNGAEWDGSWTYVKGRFEVKRIGKGKWRVLYPMGHKRAPVEFSTKAAALAFAKVEAADHGTEVMA